MPRIISFPILGGTWLLQLFDKRTLVDEDPVISDYYIQFVSRAEGLHSFQHQITLSSSTPSEEVLYAHLPTFCDLLVICRTLHSFPYHDARSARKHTFSTIQIPRLRPILYSMSSIRSMLALAVVRTVAGAKAPEPTDPVAAAAAAEKKRLANQLNQQFYDYIFIILAGLIMGLIIWRVTLESVKYVRTLACLNNDTQRYFTKPAQTWSTFKKSLLYAPIWGTRHNREFKLSAAVNVGTLPTRFQLLFLSAYLGTNVAFCVVSINWDEDYVSVCRAIRNRTGILSVVNMVSTGAPFFIFSRVLTPLGSSIYHGCQK